MPESSLILERNALMVGYGIRSASEPVREIPDEPHDPEIIPDLPPEALPNLPPDISDDPSPEIVPDHTPEISPLPEF